MVGDQGEIWDAVGAWCWSGCSGSRASERMENDRYFVTYRPLQPVNRDAMAAFLYRMAGSPAVRLPAASPFKGVSPRDQHYKAIIWAKQRGITTG